MQARTRLAVAGCALALLGCGGQSAVLDQPLSLLTPPTAFDHELVFIDTTSHRAILLDGASPSPEPRPKAIADLPYGPALSVRRNGTHDQLLVLCAGQRSSSVADAEPAALALLDNDGSVRNFELGTTPFDTLIQSEDGRYAVLLRAKNDAGRLLGNANELAIVDLDAKAGTPAVTHKTPQSFGHTPTGAVFSKPMTIAGESRRLLVVLSAAEVTLIDLGHLDRRETIVQLGDSGRTINPTQVLFSDSDPTLYVRGQASDDIYVFQLEPFPNDKLGNDFQPSINQLGGGGPTDMQLFGKGAARRLLITSLKSQAIVVDPTSSKATNIALPNAANKILLFTATAPNDSKNSTTRALLYSQDSSTVVFLDLADIETRKERNIETLTLDQPIGSLIPLLSEHKVVVLHRGTGVSVLDLAERTIAPITSSSALTDAQFDTTRERLWVAPSGQPRIGTLDLKTGATDEVLLDQNVELMVPLFDAKRVAIVHHSDIGFVTFLDSAAPSRQSAVSVRGFFIADILDRGGK